MPYLVNSKVLVNNHAQGKIILKYLVDVLDFFKERTHNIVSQQWVFHFTCSQRFKKKKKNYIYNRASLDIQFGSKES